MPARKKTSRGTEDQFNALHSLITTSFIERLQDEEVSTADLRAAAEWCIKNDINSPAMEGTALDNLRSLIPQLNVEDMNHYARSKGM